MIWIFNRKEAAVTNSMEQQARWRAAFSKAGVEYDVKVTDRTSCWFCQRIPFFCKKTGS